MPSDEALVVDVARIARTRESRRENASEVTVEFGDGSTGTLDVAVQRDQVWAEVLQSLKRQGRPAFVKLDARSRRITLLLIPFEFRVVTLEEADGGDLRIEFDPSHAIHWLRRTHPQFEAIRKLLEDARRRKHGVLVTESLERPEIIDVRVPG